MKKMVRCMTEYNTSQQSELGIDKRYLIMMRDYHPELLAKPQRKIFKTDIDNDLSLITVDTGIWSSCI